MTAIYWVQTQAPAGNWVDRTGSDDLKNTKQYAEYEAGRGVNSRVIERFDKVLHVYGAKRQNNPRPRIGSAKPGRVSSATGMRPSKRLVSRRKSNTRKGYFPNPINAAAIPESAILIQQKTGNNWETVTWFTGTASKKLIDIQRKMWESATGKETRVTSNKKGRFHNPVRPLAKRAGIRFYRQAGAKWLMFDPASYPAKTKNEALKIARALGQMFKTQIKIVIDK